MNNTILTENVGIQIQMPERVKIEDYPQENRSRFILRPLEKGYGVTIGNSLRRALLSSIPGSAIIGVKISDVLHEFQTIDGVVEDVSEIILNLKEVRFKLLDKKLQRIMFHLKGPHIWTAKDIQDASDQIEVIDPEKYIAEITGDIELDIELRIGRGRGYVPSEAQQIVDFPIGMLPIDAIFTPIKNVIYNVENFRVGQKTDYEQLILDVITDGTITPQESINIAASLLIDHFKFFVSLEDIVVEEQHQIIVEEEVKEAERNKLRKILLTSVDELELSVRAHNCLKAANIKTLGDLVRLQESELLKFRNFGRKSLNELADVVRQYGLEFGMNVDKFLKEDSQKLNLSELY